MKIEDAAWLAGYLDGDGCICLGRKGKLKFRKISVVIDSADLEILEYVVSISDGSLVTKKKAKDHHRQCWSWRLTGATKIISLLTQVLPFMRCIDKKMRADMIVNEWSQCTPRNGYYTEEMAAQKISFETRFLTIGSNRGNRIFTQLAAMPTVDWQSGNATAC